MNRFTSIPLQLRFFLITQIKMCTLLKQSVHQKNVIRFHRAIQQFGVTIGTIEATMSHSQAHSTYLIPKYAQTQRLFLMSHAILKPSKCHYRQVAVQLMQFFIFISIMSLFFFLHLSSYCQFLCAFAILFFSLLSKFCILCSSKPHVIHAACSFVSLRRN